MKRDNWEVEDGSVFVGSLKKLPYSEEYPRVSCPVCDHEFNCGHRWLIPYEVFDKGHEGEVVYQCDYDKCEFTIPAEWVKDEEKFVELARERYHWSSERLKNLGKHFPGEGKPYEPRR